MQRLPLDSKGMTLVDTGQVVPQLVVKLADFRFVGDLTGEGVDREEAEGRLRQTKSFRVDLRRYGVIRREGFVRHYLLTLTLL